MDSCERAKLDLLYWGGTVLIAIVGLFLLNYLWSLATSLLWYGRACPVPLPSERSVPEPPYRYCPPPWEQMLALTPQLFPVATLGLLGFYMRNQTTPP